MATTHPLEVESWVWYGVTCLIALARLTSRSLTFKSYRKLQTDDWIMLGALSTYTTFLVAINIVAEHDSNLLPPNYDISRLTAQEVASRAYGSKMILVVEICQCVTIWAVKTSLLIMYWRLTIAMRENWFVKGLAVYTAFGFVFMMVMYLGVWCRPFSAYWAVPTSTQCSAATNHLITNAVLNLSSDLAMLTLALQMFVRSKLPLQRKLLLCGIFGLGAFVILAAVLNKYYSFSEPFGSQWTFWYVRESSTALLVGNLPYTWTLLRRVFKLRAFNPDSSDPNSTSRIRSPTQWHRSSRNALARQDRGRASPNGGSGAIGGRGISRTRSSSGHSADGRPGGWMKEEAKDGVYETGYTRRDKDLYRLPSLDGVSEAGSPRTTMDLNREMRRESEEGIEGVAGLERAYVAPERMV